MFVDATKVEFGSFKVWNWIVLSYKIRQKTTSSGKCCFAPLTLLIHSLLPTNGPHNTYLCTP